MRKYDLLFAPLLPFLAGCTRLFLAPDGELANLPFHILPAPETGYLGDRYRICYLTAGRDLLRLNRPVTLEAGPPLVCANPDFDLTRAPDAEPARPQRLGSLFGTRRSRSATPNDASAATDQASRLSGLSRDFDPRTLRFEPLPGTRLESEAVAQRLQVTPIMAADALKQRIKGWRSHILLHLSTHGYFMAAEQNRAAGRGLFDLRMAGPLHAPRLENPLLRSWLALAGANTFLKGLTRRLPPEAENGILTAADITGWDLLSTLLVSQIGAPATLIWVKVEAGRLLSAGPAQHAQVQIF